MQHRQHFQARELHVPNDFACACIAKVFLAGFFWDREHHGVKGDAPHCLLQKNPGILSQTRMLPKAQQWWLRVSTGLM